MLESAATDSPARAPLAAVVRPAAGWAPALLVAAGVAAYANSLGGAFVYDDRLSILKNPTIQRGWLAALQPPGAGVTVSGRPLANLTFALNYELSGDQAWSYHVVNVAIHLLAGLALFGLVRRTLELPKLRAQFAGRARAVALAAALLWVLHPLQTDAVTYLVQRVESLMGLFYLLTLYCFVRAMTAPRAKSWLVGSAAACLLGMFCKEVMVTAPLLTLLYDRTFVAGTFAEAGRRRAQYYAALAATWLPLAGLVWSAGDRGATTGFHAGLAWPDYAWAQFPVIAHYLSLAAWPHPQIVDYGPALAAGGGLGGVAILLIGALAAATLYLLWRRPLLGFLGAWFFVILAPSSSVIPIATEIAAEHRLYLPLAALAVLAAAGLAGCAGPRLFAAAVAAWALALGALTFERNRDFQTEVDNYQAMVASAPGKARAHEDLGVALAAAGRLAEGAQEFKNALRLDPTTPEVEHNLGYVLAQMGQADQAIIHYRNALRLVPDSIPDHTALGGLLAGTGQFADASTEFAVVARLQPDSAEAHLNLGNTLAQAGNFSAAAAQYAIVVKIKPGYVAAHYNLGLCWVELKRYDQAVGEYEVALRLDPANKMISQALDQARAALRQSGAAAP